ncbi:MFS transporter [Vibrio sp. T187]|uniref:MFS transporter n=1 Tax=Vibrio TaxID=662 RepID=UPI0010C96DD1|nr:MULTISPECIES: MFS transporter [Vibrio]MBW3695389.1 MFS transporter [Vibrio sp. T187]
MKNRTMPYLTGRFFDGISSGLFMMALPWVMLATPNMGTFVALVALTCTAVSFLATPFFSTLIDRHSRKSLLVVIQMLQAATAGAVFLAYWFGMDSHWLLAAAQLVFWVSSNLAWSTNNAFTQENYDKHEYASISGYQEIVMQGTTLGAGALGIVLLQTWGMLEFALFAASASAIATLSYLMTPYRQQVRNNQNTPFMVQLAETRHIFGQAPRFYGFLLLSSLSYPILTFLGKLVPIRFAEQGISGDWYAMYNIAFGAGSLLTGLFIAKLLSKTSHLHTIQYSMYVLVLMLLGMSWSQQPIYLMVFTVGFGFFNALNRIARTNWMHHTIQMAQRGRVDGGIAMFATMVQSLSYVMIAALSHYQLTYLGFIIAAAVVAIASVVMGLLANNPSQPLNEATQP